MKKEDLLKLADLLDRNPMYNCDLWEPHNNLNQAFECLEQTGYKWTLQSVEDCMDKIVYIYADQITQGYAATLSQAICNAILKVVG